MAVKKLLLYCITCFSALSCGISHTDGVIDLSGSWDVIYQEDPGFAGGDYRGAAPGKIELPGYWQDAMLKNRDMRSVLWVRKKVRIDETMKSDLLVLSLGRIACADETYFNGKKIGAEGRFPDSGALNYQLAYLKNRRYYIPREFVKEGQENILSIRIFSHIMSGMSGSMKITDYTRWNKAHELFDDLPQIMNIGFFLLNTILTILLLFVFTAQKRRREFIYATGLIIVVGIIHSLIFGMLPVDGLTLYKTFFCLILAAYLFFTLAVQDFLGFRIKSIPAAFVLLCAATWTWILLSPDSMHLVLSCGYAVLGLVLSLALYFTVMYFISFYRDPYRYWRLLFVAILLLAACFGMVAAVLKGEIYAFYNYIIFQLPLALLGAMMTFLFDFKTIAKEKNSLTQVLMRTTRELNRLKAAAPKDNEKPGPREVIYDVIEYLDASYMESYNRKALAQRFGLNEDYIGQLFKKTTGTSISNYIYDRRIDAAAELVRDTNSKIIDIAFHVGFDNLTHFYRCFKKKTGMTPKDYRGK